MPSRVEVIPEIASPPNFVDWTICDMMNRFFCGVGDDSSVHGRNGPHAIQYGHGDGYRGPQERLRRFAHVSVNP